MQSIIGSNKNNICFNFHANSIHFDFHFFSQEKKTNYKDELMMLTFDKISELYEQCQMEGIHYEVSWLQLAVFYSTLCMG